MAVAVVALVFATTGIAGAATGLLPNPLPLQKSPTTAVYSKEQAANDPPGSYASAVVLCPAGQHAVGGGTSSQSSGEFVWANNPVANALGTPPANGKPAIGWAGSIADSNGQAAGTVRVHVVCQR
jgi:hypothetical protein